MFKIPDMENNDLSELFAINHIFDLLDYQQFDTFLSENHIEKTDDLFEGYLFFIKTISRGLLDKLSRSWSINIEDNYTFTRALHRGVPLEKIKNSSKRVIFIKNLHKQLRITWKSSDFTTLNKNMENIQKNILSSIDSILNCNVKLAKPYEIFGKETVVRRLAIYYTLIFLNDARYGHPTGYFFSLCNTKVEEQYSSRIFCGYKTTLYFLWKRLLSKENVESNKLFENLGRAKDWSDLDETFDLAREVVESVEKEFRLVFGFEKYFLVTKMIGAEIWEKKLFEKPPEPSLSKDENLQQDLYWYPVQAMTGLYIFTGVATFSSLLMGTVQLKKVLKNEEKTFVVRFVHPFEENKNDYSYAILVEAFGSTGTDYSGWLVFYDCCGDYSGFAGSEYQVAEAIIKECSSQIEVINLNINKKDFLNYLQLFSADLVDKYEHTGIKIPMSGEVKKRKRLLESLSNPSIIKQQQTKIETFKGYLLELLAYYFLNSN
jgi:hypothetical protein